MTGTAWITTNPDHIVAPWDQDDITDIPLSFAAHAADVQSSVAQADVTIIADPGLVIEVLNVSANIVKVRVKRDPLVANLVIGREYGFTVRAPFADGSRRDQALWLRVKPY